jgi:NAD(P)-dependent dehydrogenase (short-subunit alcohol dehydrogenase family)
MRLNTLRPGIHLKQVFLYTDVVDFRRGHRGLASLIEHELGHDPFSGTIVNISSVDAFKAHPQNAHYAATKAAVVSLTRAFAAEVAADNILINSVAPAGMETQKAKASGFIQELAQASPLGRGAEVDEIAEWITMAAASQNTFMTRENIIVSGGYIYARRKCILAKVYAGRVRCF